MGERAGLLLKGFTQFNDLMMEMTSAYNECRSIWCILLNS